MYTTVQCNIESTYPIKAILPSPYTIFYFTVRRKEFYLAQIKRRVSKKQSGKHAFYVITKIFILFRVRLDLIWFNANLMFRSCIWSCPRGLQGRRREELHYFSRCRRMDGERAEKRMRIKRGFAALSNFTSKYNSFNGLGNTVPPPRRDHIIRLAESIIKFLMLLIIHITFRLLKMLTCEYKKNKKHF